MAIYFTYLYRYKPMQLDYERSVIAGQLPLIEQARQKEYCVDGGNEWVVSESQRICWIPPEYIASTPASHCWAKTSLFMVGQDGTLRELTF
jgi:hypothetical protein